MDNQPNIPKPLWNATSDDSSKEEEEEDTVEVTEATASSAAVLETGSSVNGNNRTDGQTSALSNSAEVAQEKGNSMTSVSDKCKAGPPRASWPSVNVEGAAHWSCSAEAAATANRPSPARRTQSQVNDSEMAIVSENMAHASLTTGNASQHGLEAAAVMEASGGTAKAGEGEGKVGVASVVAVIPLVTAAKPVVNEVKSRKKKRSTPPLVPGQTTGRWTHAEHETFLEGLKVFGREWKKVAVRIPTRSSAQVRSHAQKYFSKLTRDEQLMNQESQGFEAAAAAAAAAGSSASTASDAASASAEAMAAAQSHPPAVQRNVERILANPEHAQREVEDTLRALRERYQQLQQRLRDDQAHNPRQGSPAHRIEEEKEDNNNEQQQPQEVEQNADQRNQQPRNGKRRRGGSHGDDSSISSALSSLGNEELIALSVLGAALPNADAAAAQPPPAAAAAAGPEHARQRSSSSLESNSSGTTDTSKSAKR